jgi:hypothetical protein
MFSTRPHDLDFVYSVVYYTVPIWDRLHYGSLSALDPPGSRNPPDDNYIELMIDTFHDQRHGFLFDVNPLGMQWDALWTEGSGADYSFDTLWYSRGRLTSQGFIIWMAIPFRSLRFHPTNGERCSCPAVIQLRLGFRFQTEPNPRPHRFL